MNIKDYLHFYLGCQIYYPETKETATICWAHILDAEQADFRPSYKLLLRPTSSFNLEDRNAEREFRGNMGALVKYCLNNSIDLFELIEAGLALNKSEVLCGSETALPREAGAKNKNYVMQLNQRYVAKLLQMQCYAGRQAEPFCTCTERLPVGTGADGSHYCRGCGLKVQNGA
jgi:hypothetical protein